MADKKISQLTGASTPLAGTEVLPIVQSGATVKVAVSDLTAARAVSALSLALTSTDASAAAAPLLELYRDSASPAVSDTLGEIEFNGEDSAGNKQAYGLIHASILSPTSTAEQGQLHFETATAGALTEKMIIGTTNLVINEIGAVYNVRIEGDGEANLFYTDATNDRIGVGTATPGYRLDVTRNGGGGDNAQIARITDSNTSNGVGPLHLTIGATNHFAGNPGIVLAGTNGIALAVGDGSDLANQRKLTIDSSSNVTVNSGNLVIGTSGKGIDFSATSGTGTSELFADYEEGTWTPTITGSTTNPTVTYGLQRGAYTKVGRVVTVSCFLSWSAISGGSGNAQFSGLPFAVETSPGANGAGAISELEGFTLAAARTSVAMYTPNASTFLNVRCFGSAVSTQTIAISGLSAAGSLIFTATYAV